MLQINGLVSRRWTQRLLGGVIGACLGVAAGHAENAPSGAFQRAIAFSHVLAWAPVKPAPSRDFVFPPFENSALSLGKELKSISRTGLDFVRLAVDPGPFLQF